MNYVLDLYYSIKHFWKECLFVILVQVPFRLTTLLLIAVASMQLLSKPFYLNTSFINFIGPDKESAFQIRNVLDDFNMMGYNKIVNFNKGIRPINIIVAPIEREDKDIIGYAQVRLTYCNIVIDESLTIYTFNQVLIHELMHCYGFEHTEKRTDLMYPFYRYEQRKTIREYAEDLSKVSL